MLRSPDRKDPQPINISVETRDISESASGEHVICDIDIELKEPKSRQRTPSGDTPKSVLRRNDPRRNLFDAERESPQYRSPKDNTIESETAPMDRTFEVSPDNSPMDKTFTPDRSPGGEDDGFQSQGNRTFSKSPPKLKLNDQTLHSSPDNRNDDTFEASPHDRSFLESPEHDSSYEASPHDRSFLESPEHDSSFEASPHDRSFRESQGSSELDSSYEDSPASPRWKQRRSSQDEDETNGKQLDTTF
ncbi:hypothetical protein JTE90_018004 [Oedothorax gibbosus]|uniref:Uncharacterized protein n=1 Tax=Oedothorax gibbosus TaxID=931172 RepID=A0AAV6VA16_9ARAC|nr:hypothetical protein JTE90_018004 [Oedothorax gibbosus]